MPEIVLRIKLAENVHGGWRGIAAGRSLCNTGTYVTAFYPVIVSPETFSPVDAGRKLTIFPRCKLLRVQVTHFSILPFFDVP